MAEILTAFGTVRAVYDNAFVLGYEDGREVKVHLGKGADPEMPWPKQGQRVSVDFNPWTSPDGKKHYNYIQSLTIAPANVTPIMGNVVPATGGAVTATQPVAQQTVASAAENRDRLICRQVVFKTLMERLSPDGKPTYEPDYAMELAKDLGDRLATL